MTAEERALALLRDLKQTTEWMCMDVAEAEHLDITSTAIQAAQDEALERAAEVVFDYFRRDVKATLTELAHAEHLCIDIRKMKGQP